MQHGLGQCGALQVGTGTAAQEHTAAHLFHTAGRAAALVLHPGPAGCAPEFGTVVATVFGKLQVLRPAHQLRVDLEFGHVHGLGATLVVGHKASRAGHAAHLPALSRQPDRLPPRTRWRRAQPGAHDQRFAQPVFVQQAGAKVVQGGIAFGAGRQQVQRHFQRLGQVAAHGLGRGRWAFFDQPCRHLRLDARQARRGRVTSFAPLALQVAAQPELLVVAGMGGQAQRGWGFVLRQQLQQRIAAVDQGQRKQLAPGLADLQRVVQRGRCRARRRSAATAPPTRCGWHKPSIRSCWPVAAFPARGRGTPRRSWG